MLRRALLVGLLALSLPGVSWAQGRNPKVNYDDGIAIGSQAFNESHTRYFQLLTTPAPEDPDGEMLRYWAPQLDDFFERVCHNLRLQESEVYQYLLYPRYFAQLEKLVFEERLHPAWFDSIQHLVVDFESKQRPAPPQPLVLLQPRSAPTTLQELPQRSRKQTWNGRFVEFSGDTLFVWLPDEGIRTYQRCVLYRTQYDFLATPIGPVIPEGVAGFVPTLDPDLPIVIYASIGEHRLRRTAQHEIGHAVVESIARYLRQLAPARNRSAQRDTSCTRAWRPGSGGFSMVTHENYAEYLAFPHGQMEPGLRAALIEMVAENRIDGLAAMSTGARTHASAYIEGPARLVFLAENFGFDVPKQLLVKYNSNTCGLLDWLEELTGYRLDALEQLYRRWLRETLWAQYLQTAVPDTMGHVLGQALSGVERDDSLLLQLVRKGRQEIVLRHRDAAGKTQEDRIARDLEGIERLPLFSSPDLRHGRVAAVVRQRNREILLLWEGKGHARLRPLDELGPVREIRDPRWSPTGEDIVFRVVDRAGRNAIGHYDRQRDRAEFLVPYRWSELSHPVFATDSLVLFSSTATTNGRSDIFSFERGSGSIRNLTQTPAASEDEPVFVRGHVLAISDVSGVPRPVEILPQGKTRELMDLPFPVSNLRQSDSLLTMIATSLRHHRAPGGRALWGFPLEKLDLDTSGPTPGAADPVVATLEPPASDASVTETASVTKTAPMRNTASVTETASVTKTAPMRNTASVTEAESATETAPDPSATPAAPASGLPADLPGGTGESPLGLVISPYKQKWRLMPLGMSLSNSSTRTRGATFIGVDTEFHDRSIVAALGQTGEFDRFAIVQYRNQAARTHWSVGGYYRSLLRTFFESDDSGLFHRNQSEEGMLFAAQFHKSLVTHYGLALSLTRRSDARGLLVPVQQEDLTPNQDDAPITALQMPGLDPRGWGLSWAGVPDPALLLDDAPGSAARWGETQKQIRAASKQLFQPSETYVRPNASIGVSYSRDTRIWSDMRGPSAGSLFVVGMSSGFNATGSHMAYDEASQDSVRTSVAPGLDRLTFDLLFLTHRRLGPVDLAFRARAYANGGPQSVVYGVGGLYTVAGYPRGFLRGEHVAYTNTELRLQFWDYSRFRMPILSPIFPAGEGFFFVDGGTATDSRLIYSYGVGLRLRLGIFAFEWRQMLRSGLRNENGFTATW